MEERTRDLKAKITKDKAGKWRWRIIAGNGRTIGMSTIGYEERSDCVEMLQLMLSLEVSEHQPD